MSCGIKKTPVVQWKLNVFCLPVHRGAVLELLGVPGYGDGCWGVCTAKKEGCCLLMPYRVAASVILVPSLAPTALSLGQTQLFLSGASRGTQGSQFLPQGTSKIPEDGALKSASLSSPLNFCLFSAP